MDNQYIYWNFIIRTDKETNSIWWTKDTLAEMQEYLHHSQRITSYGFCEEVGLETGENHHIQGYLRLRKRMRQKQVWQLIKDCDAIPPEYANFVQAQAAKSSTYQASYLDKEGNHIYDNASYKCDYARSILSQSMNEDQAGFDKLIHDNEESWGRSCFVWTDEFGGKGKSWLLSRYMLSDKNTFLLPDSGSYSSILFSCIEHLNSFFKRAQKGSVIYVLCDISRSDPRITGDDTSIFSLLEKVGGGLISASFGGKYQTLICNPAQVVVVVMCNESKRSLLNKNALSFDRFKFYESKK